MINNRMFLVEKGMFVVVRDGKKEVSFNSFQEFNDYYPDLDLTGKDYIDYELGRGIYMDNSNGAISVNDAPVVEYEAVINSIDQLIANKADIFFNKTPEQIIEIKIQQLKTTVDLYIDQVASDKGYGRVGVSPSAACIGYASYTNAYQAEAIVYSEWVASIWPVSYQIISDINANLRTIPTEQELIIELPVMIWPI